MTTDHTSITYDPRSPEQNADPYPVFQALRHDDPIHRSDQFGLWIISRYADVWRGLTEVGTFSSATPNTGQPDICPRAREVLAECPAMPPTLVTADPPEQTNNRRPVQRALSARRVATMAPRIRAIAEELLAGFEGTTEIEFVSAFASPSPVRVIAELLSVPRAMHAQFKTWSLDIATGLSVGLSDEQQVQAATSTRDVQRYFLELIADRRSSPRDDLLSDLLASERPDHRGFTDAEVLSICFQFLVAGHETTTSLLTEMAYLLVGTPGLAADLLADPETHDRFIEETLRFFTPVQGRYRIATHEVQLGDHTIAAGDRLHFLLASANRDETVFADPDRFDPARSDLGEHLAFGHGTHFCVGAALARLEARIALETLLPVLAGSHFSDRHRLNWTDHFHLRAPTSLWLTLPPLERPKGDL